jgi:hypothetical protein
MATLGCLSLALALSLSSGDLSFQDRDAEAFSDREAPLAHAGPAGGAGSCRGGTACPAQGQDEMRHSLESRRLLHGFRIGGMYVNRHRQVAETTGLDIRSPFMFIIGYEFFYRIEGGDWLNVLIVGNLLVSGLEQSLFIPSANFLIGFEFDNQFQVGVGPNLKPDDVKPAHVALALGWTPLVGEIYVPVHFFFVPDVDQEHRFGLTLGVTW